MSNNAHSRAAQALVGGLGLVGDKEIPCDLAMTARGAFRELVPHFCDTDPLKVAPAQHTIEVSYLAVAASCGANDETAIELRLIPDNHEVWVRSLAVASVHRRRGLGRRLAIAAERIALAFGAARINAYPLFGAGPFWRKLGYAPHPTIAHVLTKQLP